MNVIKAVHYTCVRESVCLCRLIIENISESYVVSKRYYNKVSIHIFMETQSVC